MTAGESARREADRARERADRLLRRAELFEKGAEGESRVAQALSALGPDWTVLHDHRWPGRQLANIDHVVIGPGGIFVIDSKNWSGDLRVVDHVLRQNGRSREKAVASAADAALAVSELAGPYSHAVRPVLCFAREEEMSGWARDVMVCSALNVVHMLTSRPDVLEPAHVRDSAMRLDLSLGEAARRRQDIERAAVSARAPGRGRPRQKTTGRPRRGGASRPRTSSAGRLLAALVGGLLLMLVIPTVLPGLASALSDTLVQQFLPGDDQACAEVRPTKQDAENLRGAQERRAQGQQSPDDCP